MRLQASGEATLDKLHFESLRFHLAGENTLTAPLYDLLHNHALEVAFVSPERPKSVVTLPAAEAIMPVGLRAGRRDPPLPAERLPRLPAA